jgi:hypothetical protein
MIHNSVNEYDRSVEVDIDHESILVTADIEDRKPSRLIGVAVEGSHLAEAGPIGLRSDPMPSQQWGLGIRVILPEFTQLPLRDDSHRWCLSSVKWLVDRPWSASLAMSPHFVRPMGSDCNFAICE